MDAIKKIQKDFQDTLKKMYKLAMRYKVMSVLIVVSVLLLVCYSRKETFVIHQSLPELSQVSEVSYGFVCDMEDRNCEFPIPVTKIIVEDARGLQYMKFKMMYYLSFFFQLLNLNIYLM